MLKSMLHDCCMTYGLLENEQLFEKLVRHQLYLQQLLQTSQCQPLLLVFWPQGSQGLLLTECFDNCGKKQ
ncbi:hypothetical protein Hanom_Chr03g00252021 [Helianthus anomalus]